MNTRSKSIAPNNASNMNNNSNTPQTPAKPIQEETMPYWDRALLDGMQDINIKIDQQDIRIKNLESPKKSTSWEASSSQRKFSRDPSNENPNSSTFVPDELKLG